MKKQFPFEATFLLKLICMKGYNEKKILFICFKVMGTLNNTNNRFIDFFKYFNNSNRKF